MYINYVMQHQIPVSYPPTTTSNNINNLINNDCQTDLNQQNSSFYQLDNMKHVTQQTEPPVIPSSIPQSNQSCQTENLTQLIETPVMPSNIQKSNQSCQTELCDSFTTSSYTTSSSIHQSSLHTTMLDSNTSYAYHPSSHTILTHNIKLYNNDPLIYTNQYTFPINIPNINIPTTQCSNSYKQYYNITPYYKKYNNKDPDPAPHTPSPEHSISLLEHTRHILPHFGNIGAFIGLDTFNTMPADLNACLSELLSKAKKFECPLHRTKQSNNNHHLKLSTNGGVSHQLSYHLFTMPSLLNPNYHLLLKQRHVIQNRFNNIYKLDRNQQYQKIIDTIPIIHDKINNHINNLNSMSLVNIGAILQHLKITHENHLINYFKECIKSALLIQYIKDSKPDERRKDQRLPWNPSIYYNLPFPLPSSYLFDVSNHDEFNCNIQQLLYSDTRMSAYNHMYTIQVNIISLQHHKLVQAYNTLLDFRNLDITKLFNTLPPSLHLS